MTAAEAAASIAGIQRMTGTPARPAPTQPAPTEAQARATWLAGGAGSSGVFSLDQLVKMGKANPGAPDSNEMNPGVSRSGAPPVGPSFFTDAQMKQDFIKSGVTFNTQDAANMFAGPQRGAIAATGLPAGYYQLPGATGAEYYDPHQGQASAEFIKWANALTPADYNLDTGNPHGFLGAIGHEGEAQGNVPVNAFGSYVTGDMSSIHINNYGSEDPSQSGDALANFNAMVALHAQGYSAQDAQDMVLHTGKYAQTEIGANGETLNLKDELAREAAVLGKQSDYKDVSGYVGTGYATNPGSSGGHWESDVTGKWWVVDPPLPTTPAPGTIGLPGSSTTPTNLDDANAAIAANTAKIQAAMDGLAQERIIAAAEAAGQDPGTALKAAMNATPGSPEAAAAQAIASSGISSAQEKQIYDTYNRISDPAEKAAYIAAQDPGNLTPALRLARTAAQAGEKQMPTEAPSVGNGGISWSSAGQYDGGRGGGIKTTYGSVTQTDATTGRSIVFQNVITSEQYVGPSGRGSFDAVMNRVGGGLYGALKGFVGSGGNPFAALLGAGQGSGLLSGLNFKNPGKTGWGMAQAPGDIQNVGLDLSAAALESGSGFLGGAGVGSGLGYLRRGPGGGIAGAEAGAISGGLAGMAPAPGVSAGTWVAPTWNSLMGSLEYSVGIGSALGYLNGGWRGAESGAFSGTLNGFLGGMAGWMKPGYGPNAF